MRGLKPCKPSLGTLVDRILWRQKVVRLPYSAGFSKAFFFSTQTEPTAVAQAGLQDHARFTEQTGGGGVACADSLFFEEEHQQADVMSDVQGLKASAIGL